MMDSIILYGKPVGFLVICCHTSLSWERKVWKMAKSNYTDTSLMLLPCVFSRSSPLKVKKKNKKIKKICYPQLYFTGRRGVQTCRCSAALLVVLIASSLTRQVYFFPAMSASFGKEPWAVLLITKVEQQVLIRACGDDIICTWMAGTSTSPCKRIKRETVAPLFSSQPTWVADSSLIDIIILNVGK